MTSSSIVKLINKNKTVRRLICENHSLYLALDTAEQRATKMWRPKQRGWHFIAASRRETAAGCFKSDDGVRHSKSYK